MVYLKPLGRRLLVQIQETQEENVKGIIVPVTEIKRFVKAKVHIISDKVTEFHAEDFVLIDRYLGNEVEMFGLKYLLIKEEDVLGLFE